MKRLLLLLFVFAIVLSAQAQKLDVGVQSSIVFQALEQSNDDGTLPEIAPGFQNAVGNLTFNSNIWDGGKVNVDVFISSKHHRETYGYQGFFEMSQLPEWMKLGQFSNLYNDHLTTKAGQMTLNFGDTYLYTSVNGNVINNELIGNPIAYPALTTLGAEATVNVGMLQAMAGFSNGTTSGTVETGKGIAVHGKLTALPADGLGRVSLSFYKVDHSANGTGYPVGGTKSYLYQGGDRAGTRYDIWSGPDGGQIFFGKGQDELAVQFDGRVDLDPILLYGAAGFYRDNDINGTIDGLDNGNPTEEWRFYMLTGKYNLTDWFYLAARYSVAQAVTLNDVSADGIVQRIQAGAGFKLHDSVLLKFEYVDQKARDFSGTYINNRTNLGLNPKFSGFSIETAVAL